MEIVTANSTPVIIPQAKKETVFDLSDQGIKVLKKEDFNAYNGEVTLDLSRNCFHHVPQWISELGITKLIVSESASKFALSFETGFSKTVIVEAYGMGLKHPPQNLDPTQIRCEVDFTSHDYSELFAQEGTVTI